MPLGALADSGSYVNFQVNNCTIPAGKSTCAASISAGSASQYSQQKIYSVQNITRNITTSNLLTPSRYSTSLGQYFLDGSVPTVLGDAANFLTYGTNNLTLLDGSTAVTNGVATASCAAGSSWNGSICAAGVSGSNASAPTAPLVYEWCIGSAGGAPYCYSFTSTDPQNLSVRYEIDWDNDGVVDRTLPASGYATGSLGLSDQVWTTAGLKTFEARAVNSNGVVSPWTIHKQAVYSATTPAVYLYAPSANQAITLGQTVDFTVADNFPTPKSALSVVFLWKRNNGQWNDMSLLTFNGKSPALTGYQASTYEWDAGGIAGGPASSVGMTQTAVKPLQPGTYTFMYAGRTDQAGGWNFASLGQNGPVCDNVNGPIYCSSPVTVTVNSASGSNVGSGTQASPSPSSTTSTPSFSIQPGLTLAVPSCVISAGASTCTAKPATLTNYTSGGLYDLYNEATGVTTSNAFNSLNAYAFNPFYSGTAVDLKYGSNTLDVHPGSIASMTLTSTTATASCAAGSSWNGTVCSATGSGTPSGSTLTTAQIQSITALLQVFGADSTTIAKVQAALTGGTIANSGVATSQSPSAATAACHVFSTDLTVGSSGSELSALRKVFATAGVRMLGNYSVFDESTATDVMSFQAFYGIAQTGYVGPLTRAKLNALQGC